MSRTAPPVAAAGDDPAPERYSAARRESRRRAFLEAAGVLFVEKGYGETSLADVVKRSGGSLATLYEFFGNKAGLFRALIDDRASRITRTLSQPEAEGRSVAASLEALGRQLLELLLEPEVIAVQRLVIAESAQFPELASMYFSAGPAAVHGHLRTYLAEQARQGRLAIDDPAVAAEHFGGLVKGTCHVCALFGVPDGLTETERRQRVARAVEAFLKLYAPRAR
ncbi:MAG: TetR/AcrR family transcriptional regulator [Alphaproteobacteria bacterium]|nr:TetR/AcrR family transcriptional regulator [Alphaproteobacteria bacterium]